MNPSSPSDPELLADWLNHRRESAFRALVARYAGLVQMTARRTCGDDSLAMEAAQLTFITMARKAKSLGSCDSLGGWLHRTAMLQAKNLLRKSQSEHRKRQALAEAIETHLPSPDSTWKELQPVLDEALAALSARDREALLLRFYRALSVKEVAATLGIATAAAQKRINRATQRLRGRLAHRGLITGTTLTGSILAGFAADSQAAAPGISAFVSKALTTGTVGSTASTTALVTTASMKTTSVAVPLAAVAVGGLWIASQYLTIAKLDNRNTELRKSLSTADSRSNTQSRPLATRTALDEPTIDWVEVARQLKLGQGERSGHLRSTARLDAQFIAMTPDELLAALEEIETITLSNDAREILEERIFHELVSSEGGRPLAMDRFASRYYQGSFPWTLAACFKDWIDEEPDQAISWLQRHAGELGSPDQLVSQAFYPRLLSDPGTASRILTALPEENRLNSLRKLGLGDLDPDEQVAWVQIVRTHIPKKDHPNALTWPTVNWSDGDGSRMSMPEVSTYLDRVEASPAEREASILQAVEDGASTGKDSLTAADRIEDLRSWVGDQSQGLIDQATGKGLLGLVRRGEASYAEAAELALEYFEQSPNDDLLTPLLDRNTGDESRPSARIMAAQLTDETLRHSYQQKHK